MKKLFLSASAVLLAAPAWCQFQFGISPTYGPNGYKALDLNAGIGYENWNVQPAYDRFSSDATNGAYNTAQVRVGYDKAFWGAGVTGGGTLKQNGYADAFAGADFAVSISPSGKSVGVHRIGGGGSAEPGGGPGLARIDAGVSALATYRSQDAVTGVPYSTLTEADYSGYVGVSLIGAEISARLTKSTYDKDLATATVPPPTRNPVDGLLTFLNAYPDTSLHLQVDLPMMPLVTPFVGYTETNYEKIGGVQPGDTRAPTLGVRVGLQLIEVNAVYQHIMITGGTDQDLISVGASLHI